MMHPAPTIARLAALVAACLLAVGCGSSAGPRTDAPPSPTSEAARPDVAGPAAHDAHTAGHDASHALPATAGPGFTVADVQFMQHMIQHHAQAVVMAAMVPTHGAGARLRQLGEKIDISQRDEIARMERWLRDRDQVIPDETSPHPMDMPGMLTPEQLARLDAARGEEFERLFLVFMIEHHRGALLMVDELFATPGAGQDSDIFQFATDVDADQRAEIHIMENMLRQLEP